MPIKTKNLYEQDRETDCCGCFKAHRDNDRVVMAAYGFAPNMPEPEIVARLFSLYNELITQQ